MDLMQFRQWFTEHQTQLLQDWTQQQLAAQAMLVQDLVQAVETARQIGEMGADGIATWNLSPGKGGWFNLTKLGQEDDIEDYLETFEWLAEAAKWSKAQ